MSVTLSLGAVFPLAGAANAALLSVALAWRAGARRSRAGLLGAAFLACGALASVVITLDHAGATQGWVLPLAEALLTLAAGPLFALFIAALMGRALDARLVFIPLAAYLIALIAAPGVLMRAASIEALAPVQMAFTVLALWIALKPATPLGRLAARRRQLALTAVAAVSCMHLAQIVRGLFNASWLVDVVPYVTATLFFALAGLVYFGARAAALDPLFSVRAVSPEDAALAARLDAALVTALRNPKLTAAEAAAAADMSPEQAARALSSVHGATFKDYLTRLRVREAERLLRDPSETRTSMEAIGLLAGFGSRSAFYQAFSAHAGMSPAAFRTAPGAETRPET
ncbi:MAG: helix-turn-helix transcriptional regulator [Hyphomonadaceae bacterium]